MLTLNYRAALVKTRGRLQRPRHRPAL